MRVAVLPRDVAARVITSGIARSAWAVNAMNLVFTIPILIELLVSKGEAAALPGPVILLSLLVLLAVGAAIMPKPWIVVSFLILGIALALGVPLGIYVARTQGAGKVIFGTLNLLQTVPSIALFGLLIAPLSALGLGGIGMVPAVIALVLYALLPIVRNTQTGIIGVDRFLIDAAAGMGMNSRQIFWRVELPLGMPVFVAGLRIVIVQTIGLAVVAALIGAGGLGSFVFEGIGEYAIDLVLLGAIPAILLALTADFLLALTASLLERKRTA